jgi:hypothetical protein
VAITKATLRNRVLAYITVTGVAETPSAEDATFVDDAIEAANEELVTDGIATWATSAIPDDVADAMKQFVAGRVRGAFGKGDGTAESEVAKVRLRRLTAVQDNSGEPTRATFF